MNWRVFGRIFGANLGVALGLIVVKLFLDRTLGQTLRWAAPVLAFAVILPGGTTRAVRAAVVAAALERARPVDWSEPDARELERRLMLNAAVTLAACLALVVPVTCAVTNDWKTAAWVVALYAGVSSVAVRDARVGGAKRIAELRALASEQERAEP